MKLTLFLILIIGIGGRLVAIILALFAFTCLLKDRWDLFLISLGFSFLPLYIAQKLFPTNSSIFK